MKIRLCDLSAVAICAALSIMFVRAQAVPLFPEYLPTPDADPRTRHQMKVSIPTRMSIQRASDHLFISYDLASLRSVKITVGKKMTIGIRDELRVYLKGDARPTRYCNVFEGSMNEKEPAAPLSAVNFLKSMETLTSTQNGVPVDGKRYIVEHDIVLFETDIPAQHMWSPKTSKNYRILWEKKLSTLI